MKGSLLGMPVLRLTRVISDADALLGLPSPPGALIILLMSVWLPLALKLRVCPLQLFRGIVRAVELSNLVDSPAKHQK